GVDVVEFEPLVDLVPYPAVNDFDDSYHMFCYLGVYLIFVYHSYEFFFVFLLGFFIYKLMGGVFVKDNPKKNLHPHGAPPPQAGGPRRGVADQH
ncbi:hypothetical protein ACPTIT_31785, partial [Pseudomonas aeruginosa]|uniref:hypothetical protein n=1 Tax=Pseudomonas aeruginosa TaxID=287 RepID=UPI003CC63D6A